MAKTCQFSDSTVPVPGMFSTARMAPQRADGVKTHPFRARGQLPRATFYGTNRRTTRESFWPPNPNEFDRQTSTLTLREAFGT